MSKKELEDNSRLRIFPEISRGIEMHFKHCKQCGRLLPDTSEYFDHVVGGGGVRKTVASCKKCYGAARKERRLVAKINKMLEKASAAG